MVATPGWAYTRKSRKTTDHAYYDMLISATLSTVMVPKSSVNIGDSFSVWLLTKNQFAAIGSPSSAAIAKAEMLKSVRFDALRP